jgi:hypothetical protein
MAILSEAECQELKELAASPSLRDDLRNLARRQAGHFLRDGEVDLDLVVAFLTEFNEMIDHQPKPFKQISDENMKL